MNTGLCVLLAGLAIGSLGFEAAPKQTRRAARTQIKRQQPPPPPADTSGRSSDVDIGPWEPRPMSGEPGGFVPDRRPVVHVPTWIGGDSNYLRLAPWWHAGDESVPAGNSNLTAGNNEANKGMENLLRRLNMLYDRGFRRFSLKLPAGDPEIDRVGGRKMSSAQWWTMDAERRRHFQTVLATWIDGKERAGDPVEVGIYMGYHPADPHRIQMNGADLFDDSFTALDPERPEDAERLRSMMKRFADNVEPWLGVGITEFWFDNAAPRDLWPSLLRLANNPDYNQRARFHGEAIPVNWGGPCVYTPTEDAVRRGAWMATFRDAEFQHANAAFDPELTEIHLWLSGHYGRHCTQPDSAADAWTFEDLERYDQRGWILGPELVFASIDVWSKGYRRCKHEYYSRDSNGKLVRNDGGGSAFLRGTEAVQRVYDMGFVTCIADFNGDGKVEVDPIGAPLGRDTDLRMFDERWNQTRSSGSDGHRFVDGDVNNDGRVNTADYDAFMRAAEHYRNFRADPANASTLYTPPDFAMVDLGGRG